VTPTPLSNRRQEMAEADAAQELRALFHRLNNQLGIILSHAELLEAKAHDAVNRTRAGQVVKSVLEAMNTAKEIRYRTPAAPSGIPASPACPPISFKRV
jgi:hypothetical protein